MTKTALRNARREGAAEAEKIVAALERKADALERKTAVLEKKADVLEKKADALEKKADALEKKADALERKLANLNKETAYKMLMITNPAFSLEFISKCTGVPMKRLKHMKHRIKNLRSLNFGSEAD